MKKHLVRIIMTVMCLGLVGTGIHGGIGAVDAIPVQDYDVQDYDVEDLPVAAEDWEVPPIEVPECVGEECEVAEDPEEEPADGPDDYTSEEDCDVDDAGDLIDPDHCGNPDCEQYDPEDPSYPEDCETPECSDWDVEDAYYPEECQDEPDHPTGTPHFTG